MALRIFISHSYKDAAFAERLVKDLNAAGADAWLDKEDLGAGSFPERISMALGNCEWFVLVLTRDALASQWVRQEVEAAIILKHSGQIRELIFLQADPVEHNELPALWRVYNIFDATADHAAAFRSIQKVMNLPTMLEAPNAASPSTQQAFTPPEPTFGTITLSHRGKFWDLDYFEACSLCGVEINISASHAMGPTRVAVCPNCHAILIQPPAPPPPR